MRWWWRWSSWRRAGSTGTSRRTTLGRANLIADFLNSSAANFVQHRDHIAMTRHSFGADRNFDVRICFVQSVEPRHDFLVLDILSVETDGVTRANTDRHVVLLRRRLRLIRWQSDLNPFHVGLAQAHHHEARQ